MSACIKPDTMAVPACSSRPSIDTFSDWLMMADIGQRPTKARKATVRPQSIGKSQRINVRMADMCNQLIRWLSGEQRAPVARPTNDSPNRRAAKKIAGGGHFFASMFYMSLLAIIAAASVVFVPPENSRWQLELTSSEMRRLTR